MRKRSLFTIVGVSIITCGIYFIVVLYQIYSDINYASKERNTALRDVLLPYITCGIWGFYCMYKYSKKLAYLGAEDNTIINVILAVLGFGIVSACIMQTGINYLIDQKLDHGEALE